MGKGNDYQFDINSGYNGICGCFQCRVLIKKFYKLSSCKFNQDKVGNFIQDNNNKLFFIYVVEIIKW